MVDISIDTTPKIYSLLPTFNLRNYCKNLLAGHRRKQRLAHAQEWEGEGKR